MNHFILAFWPNTYFLPCKIKDLNLSLKLLRGQSLRAMGRQWHNFICCKPPQCQGCLLQHTVSSEEYWGHYIVRKLAHRKFHQSFAADLTMWRSLSVQKVGDHRGTVSLNRVSNSTPLISLTDRHILVHWHPTHVHKCTTQHAHTDNGPGSW